MGGGKKGLDHSGTQQPAAGEDPTARLWAASRSGATPGSGDHAPVADNTKGQRAPAGEDSAARLWAASHGGAKPRSGGSRDVQPASTGPGSADRSNRRSVDSLNNGPASSAANGDHPDDPYAHKSIADAKLQEYAQLKERKDDEVYKVVKDGTGEHKITVKEQRDRLIQECDQELLAGLNAVKAIDQDKVRALVAADSAKTNDAAAQEELAALRRLELAESILCMEYAVVLREEGKQDQATLKLAEAKDSLDQVKGRDATIRSDDAFKELYVNVSMCYAAQLADSGDPSKARSVLNDASVAVPEVSGNQQFEELSKALDQQLSDPLVVFASAQRKRDAGDIKGADADFKLAVALSDKVQMSTVTDQIKAYEKAKLDNAGNADKVKELDDAEKRWVLLAQSQTITRLEYAKFLVDQKRYKESVPDLTWVAENNPQLILGKAEDIKPFRDLWYRANHNGEEPKTFMNPYITLSDYESAYKSGDMNAAKQTLELAVSVADERIDRSWEQLSKTVIQEQMVKATDPGLKAELQKEYDRHDSFDHASGFTRTCLARFDIASKNYQEAQANLGWVKTNDSALTAKPEIQFAVLQKASIEPTFWEKTKAVTIGAVKEITCDAVSILAGAGAAIAASETGPGAIVAAGAAGGATYTGMKTLMGDVSLADWSNALHGHGDALWKIGMTTGLGTLNGISGGTAGLAFKGLTTVAGTVVTGEAAAEVVTATGGDVVALNGLHGVELARTAQTMAKTGLKTMGRDLSWWARTKTILPFVSSGSKSYDAALSAYRGLKYTNMATGAMINGGTALTGSLIYRGTHEGMKWASDPHESFGSFAKAYALGVTKDTVCGITLGAYTISMGDGVLLSTLSHGTQQAIWGKHHGVLEWSAHTAQDVGTDVAISFIPTLVSSGANSLRESMNVVKTSSAVQGTWAAGVQNSLGRLGPPLANMYQRFVPVGVQESLNSLGNSVSQVFNGSLAAKLPDTFRERLPDAVQGSWAASSPYWKERYQRNAYLKSQVMPYYKSTHTPVDHRNDDYELRLRHDNLPGTDEYPRHYR